MKEEYYSVIGWLCLFSALLLALVWSLNGTGLAGFLMDTSERYLKVRLVQISWLITFAVICIPAYIAKRYLDQLAWNEHVRNLPPPDIHESSRRSKYIQTDHVPPPAPKPVEIHEIPKDQEEFIATCGACGNLFPAKRSEAILLKCPTCGEIIATS